jgi:hypothetical protein
MGRFKVVLKASSQLRLMEKAVGPAGSWLLNKNEPGEPQVRVLDDVLEENNIPWHRGMMFEVTLSADAIDQAVENARGEAEIAATLMAAAARAPVGPARPVLAVDVTPGLEDREFLQWIYGGPIIVGKTVVTPRAFGAFHDPLLGEGGAVTNNRRLLERVLLSLSWYRFALDETDALTRFLHLWLAVEALEPLLADHFERDSQGFGGLRALAEEHADHPGEGSEGVSAVLGIRRALFHPQRRNIQTLKDSARDHIEFVETLLHHGWGAVLGVHDLDERLPAGSVTALDAYMLIRATVVHADETFGGRLPYLVSEIEPYRVNEDDPDYLNWSYRGKLSIRNADLARVHRLEIRGPQGPNVGQFVELGDERITREGADLDGS